MTNLIQLGDRIYAASQLEPADFASLHGRGIVLAINNRPDGEALFGQPRSARLEQAAGAVGIGYRQIAFSGANVTVEQVRAFQLAVSEAGGPVVAFCKSGFRSALIWAAATIAEGAEADAVIETAAKAGFDLAKWRADIERLAAEAA